MRGRGEAAAGGSSGALLAWVGSIGVSCWPVPSFGCCASEHEPTPTINRPLDPKTSRCVLVVVIFHNNFQILGSADWAEPFNCIGWDLSDANVVPPRGDVRERSALASSDEKGTEQKIN